MEASTQKYFMHKDGRVGLCLSEDGNDFIVATICVGDPSKEKWFCQDVTEVKYTRRYDSSPVSSFFNWLYEEYDEYTFVDTDDLDDVMLSCLIEKIEDRVPATNDISDSARIIVMNSIMDAYYKRKNMLLKSGATIRLLRHPESGLCFYYFGGSIYIRVRDVLSLDRDRMSMRIAWNMIDTDKIVCNRATTTQA